MTPEQSALISRTVQGEKVRVGFRPQAVEIVSVAEATFRGTVYAFNPFVTYGVLIAEVDGQRIRILTEANRHFELNENVSMRIKPADIYLFHEESAINLEYL
jgi:ABC-type sugar transport system ATPase subunit